MAVKIFSGSATIYLAEKIAHAYGEALGKVNYQQFSDGEMSPFLAESVRGHEVFIIQSTFAPSDNLMELLLMVDAACRASASSVNVIIPYFGYARQDRKDQPRVSIAAKMIANLISAAGADRIMTCDLHADQIQGFFDIPVDHLYAAPVVLEDLKSRFSREVVVVSPDAGGTERARAFAKRLNAGLAIIDKRRSAANISEVMHIIGDVDGKTCIIVDDMIDTAGTLCQAAAALKAQGAGDIYATATHAVLSGPALERINESSLKEVLVCNTVPTGDKMDKCSRLRSISVAKLLAEAIRRIHGDESVSSLFV